MLNKTTVGEVIGMIRLSNRRISGIPPKPVKEAASGYCTLSGEELSGQRAVRCMTLCFM